MYRIVLADDEGIMLESLKKIIESEYGNECEIHCAKSGRVVVETAQAYPPDICFMDIQMPGISGIQWWRIWICIWREQKPVWRRSSR